MGWRPRLNDERLGKRKLIQRGPVRSITCAFARPPSAPLSCCWRSVICFSLPSVPLVNFLVRPVEHVDQRQGAPFESNQVSIDFITYVTGRERNETRLFSRFFTTRKMFKQVRKLIILNKNSKNSSFLFDKNKNQTQFFRYHPTSFLSFDEISSSIDI